MSLENEYRELLKSEGFLKTFPGFTGEWERDRELFTSMTERDLIYIEEEVEISDEDDYRDEVGEYYEDFCQ